MMISALSFNSHTLTFTFNHKQIKSHVEKILKIKLFIDQYNQKKMDFPSQSKDWEKFEQKSKTIGLNILFLPHNTKQIRLAYISKHNFMHEN